MESIKAVIGIILMAAGYASIILGYASLILATIKMHDHKEDI